MVEKKEPDIIYPSTEQDLVEAFNESSDILKVMEDDNGLVSILYSESGTFLDDYIVADLNSSESENDKSFYPTLRCANRKSFIEINFSKNGYTVAAYDYKEQPLNGLYGKKKKVQKIMDIAQRGIGLIEIFRNIPIHLRADIRDRYIKKLDCKVNDYYEPTLDCVSLTSRAINMVQSGKIKEIV